MSLKESLLFNFDSFWSRLSEEPSADPKGGALICFPLGTALAATENRSSPANSTRRTCGLRWVAWSVARARPQSSREMILPPPALPHFVQQAFLREKGGRAEYTKFLDLSAITVAIF